MPTARSQATSLAVHATAIALLLFFTSHSFFTAPPPTSMRKTADPVVLLPPKLIRVTVTERGGGSNTSPEPARQGVPPPRSTRAFVPPEVHTNPQIPIPVTIDFDVPVINVALNDLGNPLSKFAGRGLGGKNGDGIGESPGGRGIGDGEPGRPGFTPGRIGTPTKPAVLIYRVDPEFSEDARKAKYQGIVVLMIDIGVDGRAHNPKIVQTPGLGLDAKAVEAVAQWRFRPASRDNKPVASTARVEVYFHLL
jgi:protein TonB